MISNIRKVYAHVVCFFCLAIGGLFLSMATYNVGEILFTNLLLPWAIHSDRSHEAAIEKYELIKNESQNRSLTSGVSPYPYQVGMEKPIGHGTTKWVRKESLGKMIASLIKVAIAALIFAIHWRLGASEVKQ